MDENSLRSLANRFFDALECRDVGEIEKLYAADMRFWFNVTKNEVSKEENLAAIAQGYARHRRRTYNDRIIHTFEGGFLMQYTLNIVQHTGETLTLWAALVAQCRNGQITRIDEYLDSGKFTGQSGNRQTSGTSAQEPH